MKPLYALSAILMSGYAAVFTLLAECAPVLVSPRLPSAQSLGPRFWQGFSRSCCYLGALTLAKAG